MSEHKTTAVVATEALQRRLGEAIIRRVWETPGHPVRAAFDAAKPGGNLQDFCDWLPTHLDAMKRGSP